jgi:hypothetical protein
MHNWLTNALCRMALAEAQWCRARVQSSSSAGAYSSRSPSPRRAPILRRPRLPARSRTMPLYQLVCIAAHIPDYVRPSLLCLRAGADARAPPATHQGPRPPGGDARPGPRGRRAQHPLAGPDDAPAADAPAQARAQHGRVRVSVLFSPPYSSLRRAYALLP